MKNLILPIIASAALFAPQANAGLVAHFPMDLNNGQIKEAVSGNSFDVQGNFAPENVAGASGQALRFDGYSTFVDASLGNIIPDGTTKMTFSIWTAIETYPIIQIDQNTTEKTAIASCLDESAKTGFGFFLHWWLGSGSCCQHSPAYLSVEQPCCSCRLRQSFGYGLQQWRSGRFIALLRFCKIRRWQLYSRSKHH
jgi:hypothetical protein